MDSTHGARSRGTGSRMTVTMEQVVSGMGKYADQEIIAKVAGMRKWLVALAAPAVMITVSDTLIKNKDMLVKAGYMTEDGMLDVDRIYNDALGVARKTGAVTEHLPVLGDVTFSEQDIEKLYLCIVS